jgi:pectate lyase
MSILFRRVFPSLVLVAGTLGCTLTADDYTPAASGTDDSEGMQPVSSAAQAPATDAHASRDASPGTVSEILTPGMLVGTDADGGSGSGASGRDSGAPAGAGTPPVPALPALVGWASVAGLGLETTTGGGTTTAVLVQTAEQLVALAARPEPLTLAIAGTLNVGRLNLTSDKTLFGVSAGATLRGSIAIRGTPESFVRNVIVHNLNLDAATSTLGGDGIEIRYAHHVWIDHCKLEDAADGLLDIVRGSDFVTVSRTRFLYTSAAPDPTHRFAALIGHDVANTAEDQGHLNVTWHHNWWSDGVSRALLGRFGQVHLFNNLFASAGNVNVLEADVSARLLVENNVFAGVASPHAIITGSSGALEASGNAYLDTTGPRDVAGTAFVPPYAYELEAALPTLATGDVGPR